MHNITKDDPCLGRLVLEDIGTDLMSTAEKRDIEFIEGDQEVKKSQEELEKTLNVDQDKFDVKSESKSRDIDEEKDGELLALMKSPSHKVKVSVNEVLEDLTPQHIYDLLNGSKNIDEIVVEQVKLGEASRTKFKIDPENLKGGIVENLFFNDRIQQLEKEQLLKLGERVLNNDLFNDSIEDIIEAGYDEDNVIHLGDRTKESSSNLPALRNNVIDTNILSKDKDIEKIGEIVFNRHQIKRRITKKSSANNFYKALNHSDLFKVGQSYLKDFTENKNAFAFTHMENKLSSEKTVFGITSFFNFYCQAKVTIFTSRYENSFYQENFANLKYELVQIPALNIQFKCMSSDIVEIIEFETIMELMDVCPDFDVDEFIEWYKVNSDLVLFDIPKHEEIDKARGIYFPIINRINNISLVVEEEESKLDKIGKLISFYENYGVDIKGALIKKKKVSGDL